MGKLGVGGGGNLEKKKKNGKLGTDNEKAIGSIANVNVSFFQFENRWNEMDCLSPP